MTGWRNLPDSSSLHHKVSHHWELHFIEMFEESACTMKAPNAQSSITVQTAAVGTVRAARIFMQSFVLVEPMSDGLFLHAACVKMLGCAGHVRIGSVTNIMRRIWTQRMSAPLTDGGEETGTM